jgi:tyrosine-protein phosphatase SIW14
MYGTMMLESALKTIHIFPQTAEDEAEDDGSILYPSTSDHAVSTPLPILLYTPPVNFGMVTHSLYRSSFPQKENFAYLRRLGLKSVLYVSPL